MTREETMQALALCAADTNRCHECKLFQNKNCCTTLKNWALFYLNQETEKTRETRLEVPTPNNPGHALIGEIISHYKKPFVTININVSEEST